jgi:hypothetical protein
MPIDAALDWCRQDWGREEAGSSGGCWTWRPHGVAPHNPPEARRSSS